MHNSIAYLIPAPPRATNNKPKKHKKMKMTMTRHDIKNALLADTNAGWSYAGACALAEWLDDLEPADTEFDAVAIRCDFSEYGFATSAAVDYGWDAPTLGAELLDVDQISDEAEAAAIEWLQSKTVVIEIGGRLGGIIVANF